MELKNLARVCQFDCGLTKEKPLIVGVSGGPDSLCLLHVLVSLGYRCVVVHVNHQLRSEAAAEAEVVRAFCQTWGVPFVVKAVDAQAFAGQEKLSIEEGARILRYRALMQAAEDFSAQAVAVAHHADDQVETVLMHLLRGAGPSGLKGMTYRSINAAFSETVPIVRPMLGVERADILAYCQEQKIEPCQDASNSDPTYFRNRIRQELVPLLKTYNSQSSRHLWQLAALVGEEDRYLDQLMRAEAEAFVVQRGAGFLVLDRQRFQMRERVEQRRLMRLCLSELRSNLRDIGYEPVEGAIDFVLEDSAHGQFQVLADVFLVTLPDERVLLFTEQADFSDLWPLLGKNQSIEVLIPGDYWLNGHWKLAAETLPVGNWEMKFGPEWAYFDAAALSHPLQLGGRKNGERFSPFGMATGSIKVGDFFTNLHYPAPARQTWPILRMDGQILWVVGLRRAKLAAVTDATRQVVCMHLVKVE
jgi:tRNA(Ile)-lysidine synthetase, N-terminal domain